jgi:hypothetical protein
VPQQRFIEDGGRNPRVMDKVAKAFNMTASTTVSMTEVRNPAPQTSTLRQQDSGHNIGKSAQVALVSRGNPLAELVKQLKIQGGHETGTLTGLVAFGELTPNRFRDKKSAIREIRQNGQGGNGRFCQVDDWSHRCFTSS